MKGRISAAALVAAALGLTLGGCAAIRRDEARHKENLLVAAGFRMKPANKLIARTNKSGQMVYTYADPLECKCMYVGMPEQYAEYRRLALQQQMAEDQLSAAMANESAAMDWGMWGPWGMW